MYNSARDRVERKEMMEKRGVNQGVEPASVEHVQWSVVWRAARCAGDGLLSATVAEGRANSRKKLRDADVKRRGAV